MEYYTRNIKGVVFSGEVEVDESMFGRRTKYHREDPQGIKVWIVRLVERSTNHLKLFPVDHRDQDILICIIKENVLPGSTIYTDGWSSYQNLRRVNSDYASWIMRALLHLVRPICLEKLCLIKTFVSTVFCLCVLINCFAGLLCQCNWLKFNSQQMTLTAYYYYWCSCWCGHSWLRCADVN